MAIQVFHHNDLDGRCAAAIINHWVSNKRPGIQICFHEVDYKDEINLDSIISPDDEVFIVDFSFKPKIMREIARKVGTKLIWCDHHVTAKEYNCDDLFGKRDFTEKGLSGCECTFLFLFPGVKIPDAIQLIGDYDSWRLRMPDLSLPFYEGMKAIYPRPNNFIWYELMFGKNKTESINEIISSGRTIIDYRDNYCLSIADKYGYETTINGIKAFVMNLYKFGSQGFGEYFKKYPICIAYIFDGKKYTVSLYSETIDVSIIAKYYSGGGHKGAAGFVCEKLPFIKRDNKNE